MKPVALILAALLPLSACGPLSTGPTAGDGPTCETRPAAGCAFDRDPLHVLPEPVTLPRRPYQFFPTAEALNFVDARGRTWTAPRRTLTDGASIPRLFVGIVGDPTSREFINAAAMHDAYCGIGNEEGQNYRSRHWEDTHRMFFDGLIAGGVKPAVAKMMFSAVWLGGPRWNTGRRLDHVPAARLQQAMRETRAFIDAATPDTPGDDNRGGSIDPAPGNAGLAATGQMHEDAITRNKPAATAPAEPMIATQGAVGIGVVGPESGPRFSDLMRYLRMQESRLLAEYPVWAEDAPHHEDPLGIQVTPICKGDDCFDPTRDPSLPDLDGDGLPG